MPTVSGSSFECDDALKAYHDVSRLNESLGIPFSNESRVNLTDAYQIRMAYAYWQSGKADALATFEVFYRKAPFEGQFAILAGVDEVLRAINVFRFEESDFDYMQTDLDINDDAFFQYLRELDMRKMTVHAQKEGSITFARTPLLQISGPLCACQLLETLVLNLLNFASLISTNAMGMRLAAGFEKYMVEFGLRRAQGPDGAMSASRYSYLGGFDASSNVRAGKIFGLPVVGTHAHSFVTAYTEKDLLDEKFVPSVTFGDKVVASFKEDAIRNRKLLFDKCPYLGDIGEANNGELAAFITFARSFPKRFVALIDTFDSIRSGFPNYLAVAMTIQEHIPDIPVGLRLDSGDLAYLSRTIRALIVRVAAELELPSLLNSIIFASNDINKKVLSSLNDEGHAIDSFGIGTNLVTCQAQSALGLVYKMTSLDGMPKMKISENREKNSIPYEKSLYRFYNSDGDYLMDYLVRPQDPAPQAGTKIFARHLLNDDKRCYVLPDKVESILHLELANGERVCPKPEIYIDYLNECRNRALEGVKKIRTDHLRPTNPSDYKISTSDDFFQEVKNLRMALTPIKFLS